MPTPQDKKNIEVSQIRLVHRFQLGALDMAFFDANRADHKVKLTVHPAGVIAKLPQNEVLIPWANITFCLLKGE